MKSEDYDEKAVQKVISSMERHVRVLKERSEYDSELVEEAVERWKNDR